MIGDAGAGGLLVNISGEVIGWITDAGNPDAHARISAVSISCLKGIIECLSNGSRISVLGVQAEEVTAAIAQAQELPEGLYVTNTIADSPAYNEGIRNGDIIVKIDEREIRKMYDLQSVMLETRPGTEVRVTVMREGRDGFAEKEFVLTLGER